MFIYISNVKREMKTSLHFLSLSLYNLINKYLKWMNHCHEWEVKKLLRKRGNRYPFYIVISFTYSTTLIIIVQPLTDWVRSLITICSTNIFNLFQLNTKRRKCFYIHAWYSATIFTLSYTYLLFMLCLVFSKFL